MQLGAKNKTLKKKRSLKKSLRVRKIKMLTYEMYVHTYKCTCTQSSVKQSLALLLLLLILFPRQLNIIIYSFITLLHACPPP